MKINWWHRQIADGWDARGGHSKNTLSLLQIMAAFRKWTFNTAASIRFGPGCLSEVGTLTRAKGYKRTLLITDPGMVSSTNIVDRALKFLTVSI